MPIHRPHIGEFPSDVHPDSEGYCDRRRSLAGPTPVAAALIRPTLWWDRLQPAQLWPTHTQWDPSRITVPACRATARRRITSLWPATTRICAARPAGMAPRPMIRGLQVRIKESDWVIVESVE